jgi:ribonuclease-3
VIKNLISKVRLFMTRRRQEPYLLLRDILGFYPKDLFYYELALKHRSTAAKDENGRKLNNERLEFLGDAMLAAVVADILYYKYKKEKEGFLTNLRAKIVQRETLNRVALEMGLDKHVSVSHKSNTHNINVYGNALEALVGAVYLDRGYEKCKEFIADAVIAKHLNINKMARQEINFKSRLIEWSQKNKASLVFDLIEESMDKDNNPIFQTQVIVNGVKAGEGVGYTKKESQQVASKVAFKRVKENGDFYISAGNNNPENNNGKTAVQFT